VNKVKDDHSCPQLYPFALVPLGELQNYIRARCTEEENRRLPALTAEWTAIQPTVTETLRAEGESGVADMNATEPLPEKFSTRLAQISGHPAFSKTFSFVRTTFELVEIDNLVATQRSVSLDHMNFLMRQIPEKPTIEELIDFCLEPNREVDPDLETTRRRN
jgi:hypothetical protein